jgi:hypothetical protein
VQVLAIVRRARMSQVHRRHIRAACYVVVVMCVGALFAQKIPTLLALEGIAAGIITLEYAVYQLR